MQTLEQQQQGFTKEELVISNQISSEVYDYLIHALEKLPESLQHPNMLLFVVQSLAAMTIAQHSNNPSEDAKIFAHNVHAMIANINKFLADPTH